MNEQKPLVSIGIIFRNDIRSIERCLKALQPLRDAVPCELVMADTGSTDGSRAVAEQYADILFNFTWINDFAAARNAVIDRCTGEWYLSVDTDEYLDEDISELLNFLRTPDNPVNLGRVNIRNYKSYEMDGPYADFYTLRMVRLAPGVRFEGAIHEAWIGTDHMGPGIKLAKTIFHHDGYVGMGQNSEKLKRNMTLLRQKLKKEPQNLLIRLQLIESGIQETDYLELLRKAVMLVRRKPAGWQLFGPPIFRYAVVVAKDRKLPEFQKWANWAQDWFPDSYYTRIDVTAQCVATAFENDDYAACIQQGESLMEAYADYRAGRGDMDCQMYSTLHLSSPFHEQLFRLMIAVACAEEGHTEKAYKLLEAINYSLLDSDQVNNLTKLLCSLQSKGRLDLRELILTAWEGITAPVPSEKRAEERRLTFMLIGSAAFTAGYRREEELKGYPNHAYTIFTPLAGRCGLGTAAAIMTSQDPAEMGRLLSGVEKWNELPFPALSCAIEAGVPFPLPGKPLNAEEMEGLANRLAGDWDALFALVKRVVPEETDPQVLTWNQMMTEFAVRNCAWKNEAQGLEMARIFAEVERTYLARYYTPEMLLEENVNLLPPMHRFGWYCSRAFISLDAGDVLGYTRYLRKGLSAVEQGKPMVEFLLEHTPELQTPPPSQELVELADKVRDMLATFDPDDPAVAAIKASPVYQKVAYLIEGVEAPVMGGLAQ